MIAGRAGSSSVSACCRQVASWSRLRPGYQALTNSSARLAPERAAEAFQASKRPTATSSQRQSDWGERNHLAGPEGGQDLRPGTLKPTEQSVSRLDAGLDRQELLLQRAAGGWRDLKASLPSRLATGLDGLVGGSRIAREILCARKKKKGRKEHQNQKTSQSGRWQERTKR